MPSGRPVFNVWLKAWSWQCTTSNSIPVNVELEFGVSGIEEREPKYLDKNPSEENY